MLASTTIGAVFTGCMHTHPIRDMEFQLRDAEGKVVLSSVKNLATAVQAGRTCPNVSLIIVLDSHLDREEERIGSPVKIISIFEILKREAKGSDIKLPIIPLTLPPAKAVAFSMYWGSERSPQVPQELGRSLYERGAEVKLHRRTLFRHHLPQSYASHLWNHDHPELHVWRTDRRDQ